MSIFTPTGTMSLPAGSDVRRTPPRPEQFRQPHYLAVFDDSTVFYDVFSDEQRDKVIAIGPPPLNLQKFVDRMLFGRTEGCSHVRQVALDRCTRWEISAGSMENHLTVDSDIDSRLLKIGENEASYFEGQRVLLTVSKDNDLSWVKDWARFYAREHGATAILIYDNASTRYNLNQLHDALVGLGDGLKIALVTWPFPWGARGIAAEWWDSDFCQYGALEHARRKFLMRARSVVFCDIDELMIYDDGGSVFEKVETSVTGKILLDGCWIENIVSTPVRSLSDRRHADFFYRTKLELARSPTKWAICPASCPDEAQWKAHNVTGILADDVGAAGGLYRHFRPITTNWAFKRDSALSIDPTRHELDQQLVCAIERTGIART